MAEKIAERVTIVNCQLDAALHYNPPLVLGGGIFKGVSVQCRNCMSHAGAKPINNKLEIVPNTKGRSAGPVNTLLCPPGTNCLGNVNGAKVENVMLEQAK